MADMFAEVLPHPFAPKTADGSAQMIMLMGVTRDADTGLSLPPNTIPAIFTAGSEDRHGSSFDPEGWELEPYKRNPVGLWSHMTKIPMIFNARELRRDGALWRANLEFALEEWDAAVGGGFNLCRLIHGLMSNNKLRAMSQGFIPKKWEDRQATTIPTFFAENVRYTRQELTEMSVVNVPSNRDAVRTAISDGLISGNEADALLGFGFSLHADAPAEIRTKPTAPAKTPAKTIRAAVREVMAKTRDCYPCGVITACGCVFCYCNPGTCECDCCCTDEQLTPEQQAAELAIINAMAAEQLAILSVALDAWKNSEHEALRVMARGLAFDAMYCYDRLAEMAEQWFDVDLNDASASIDAAAFGDMTTAAPEKRFLLASRAGAVLSSNNAKKVQALAALHEQGSAICLDLLASAGIGETAPADEPRSGVTIEDFNRALNESNTGGAADGTVAMLHARLAEGTPDGRDGGLTSNTRGYLPRINIDLASLTK